MDPASAWGVINGALQVVQIISQTIHGLAALRGKYQNADLTIRSLIGELSTIKSAITQLHDWATYNAEVSSTHSEYEESLSVAIDGCQAIMEVLSEKVAEMNDPGDCTDSTVALSFRARIKVVWNEDLMAGLQERLHSQVRALNLLLQACQCRSSTEQLELLRKVESRHIIKKVAEDTATLRSTIGSTATSQVDSRSIQSRQLSSIGVTKFEFDDALLATSAYQTHRRPQSQIATERSVNNVLVRGPSAATIPSVSDEGYATHSPTPSHTVSTRRTSASSYAGNPLGPNDSVYPEHSRSKSVSFGAQAVRIAPETRRWSSTGGGSKVESSSGSKRERFFSAFKRLNTSSRANLATAASPTLAKSPTGPRRGRRGREADYTTSIDLSTQSGSTAPAIVKAAQSGTRLDVERLVGMGHDIEECHLYSQRNALMVAAHCGKEDIADLLIQNNAQLTRADASGSTALHLAASRGHSGVVALLLTEAINIEAETQHGRTALWVSANNGHLQTTQLLLEGGAKVNARADNQMTALHVAAKRGDADIAGLLVTYGADIDTRDARMMTALHYACEGGHLEVVELLLDNKANIDIAGDKRKTPLICAAAAGQLLAVQLLMKRRAKFKSVDEGGMTAIHWAAFNGHVEVVHFLYKEVRGSLALKNAQGRTPLHLAAMNSRFPVVDFLVRKDCLLETKCNAGFNALHYACRADSVEIVRLLLMSGADVESQVETTRERPIHIAAAGASVRLLTLLCEQNASLEARDASGDRALCVASRHGQAAAVQILLDQGSPLHLRYDAQSYEDSPLCLAAKGGHLPVVSLLISHGASVLGKDELGLTPVRYAAYHGHPEVLQALIAAEPSALNQDYGFSPESFGLSIDGMGFALDADITPERKQRVVELLKKSSSRQSNPVNEASQSVRQLPILGLRTTHRAAARTGLYHASNLASPAMLGLSTTRNYPELTELPGNLEQGLPSSRSVTPTQMHRGHQGTSESGEENSSLISSAAGPPKTPAIENEPSEASRPWLLHQPQPQMPRNAANIPFNDLSKSLSNLALQVESEHPREIEHYPLAEAHKTGSTSPKRLDSPKIPSPIPPSPSPEVVVAANYVPNADTYNPPVFPLSRNPNL